jgi:hypothetical protein
MELARFGVRNQRNGKILIQLNNSVSPLPFLSTVQHKSGNEKLKSQHTLAGLLVNRRNFLTVFKRKSSVTDTRFFIPDPNFPSLI